MNLVSFLDLQLDDRTTQCDAIVPLLDNPSLGALGTACSTTRRATGAHLLEKALPYARRAHGEVRDLHRKRDKSNAKVLRLQDRVRNLRGMRAASDAEVVRLQGQVRRLRGMRDASDAEVVRLEAENAKLHAGNVMHFAIFSSESEFEEDDTHVDDA